MSRPGKDGESEAPRACMIAYSHYFTDARIKNYVRALLRSGWEVDVFSLGRHSEEPTESGLRVFELMGKYRRGNPRVQLLTYVAFLLVATVRVGLASAARRYRLVHVHNMPDILILSGLIPRVFGAKVLLDIHDAMPETWMARFGVSPTHPIVRALVLEETASARLADAVLTVNDPLRETLIGHGIPREKVGVIVNTPNDELFRPPATRSSRADLTLGFHGTIAKRLGVGLVVDALGLVRAQGAEVRLVLIGDGDFREEVDRQIDRLGLSAAVDRVGFVPLEELCGRLAGVDLGVVGNLLQTEQAGTHMLPVKMLEYAAMEVPCVAPRLPTIQSYFDDSCALFYEPDSARDMAARILAAYEDRSIIEACRSGLRAFNGRMRWSVMERRYLELVLRLTGIRG